jgi:toxin ParE1/3/4
VAAPNVVFGPQAEADLLALYRYISEAAGLAVAGQYIDRIETACLGLAAFPNRGKKRDDLKPRLTTLAFERRVTIACTVSKTRIKILTIAYGGRDFENEW